jgi:uncharacterized protein YlxW (UPF0749 family)
VSSAPAPLPARVRTPLLELITQESLDQDYRHVANRRHALGRPVTRSSSGRTGLTAVSVILFGLLIAIAAVQTSRTAPIRSASDAQLIARISERRAAVATLQKTIAQLRQENTARDAAYAALGAAVSQATATQRSLLRDTGWSKAHGPGVEFRIDDAPGGNSSGQVRDSDLAGLVNGLWQAGATAIAVNGQRVTALSSLRNTATVVRINDVALSPPYTVVALGDTKTLQSRFVTTTSGMRLLNLTSQFGMPFTRHNEDNLTVPAAPMSMLTLRHATVDPSKRDQQKTDQKSKQKESP